MQIPLLDLSKDIMQLLKAVARSVWIRHRCLLSVPTAASQRLSGSKRGANEDVVYFGKCTSGLHLAVSDQMVSDDLVDKGLVLNATKVHVAERVTGAFRDSRKQRAEISSIALFKCGTTGGKLVLHHQLPRGRSLPCRRSFATC